MLSNKYPESNHGESKESMWKSINAMKAQKLPILVMRPFLENETNSLTNQKSWNVLKDVFLSIL